MFALSLVFFFFHPAMTMVSDIDIRFVAMHCNLTDVQMDTLYLHLGPRRLTEADIADAKFKTAGKNSFKLQAVDVLRCWRLRNSNNATRMALVEALDACGCYPQVRTLEQKWDITLEGMYHGVSQSHTPPNPTHPTTTAPPPPPPKNKKKSSKIQDKINSDFRQRS